MLDLVPEFAHALREQLLPVKPLREQGDNTVSESVNPLLVKYEPLTTCNFEAHFFGARRSEFFPGDVMTGGHAQNVINLASNEVPDRWQMLGRDGLDVA